MRSCWLLCAVVLAGCASAPKVRPIMTVETRDAASGPVASTVVSPYQAPARVVAASAPAMAGVDEVVPRMDCRATLSREDDLTRAIVEQRVREGSHFAALALVQALPAENARVAILRADILRRLGMPQAVAWYQALREGCMAGLAEHGLGLMAAQRGDSLQALRHLVRAAVLVPSDARVRNDLGYVRLQLGQDPQAEFELRTAAELAPDDRMPLFNLALMSLLRGDVLGWVGWSTRLQPDDKDLAELAKACVQLMRSRLGRDAACPVNPSRFAPARPAPG